LHVTERDRISFSCGPFQEGYRDIPLTRIERIDAIHVQEVAANSLLPYRTVSPGSFSRANPNTYSVQRIGANFRIQRSFLPTTSQERTFLIDYNAHGALRVYDDAPVPYHQISWSGVAPS
jgi:hypothetical protein